MTLEEFQNGLRPGIPDALPEHQHRGTTVKMANSNAPDALKEHGRSDMSRERCPKVMRLGVLAIVACMALFVGCKDDDLNGNDYRDKMVGTYVGDSEYHYSSNGGENVLDTVYRNDTLSVAMYGDQGLTIGYRNQLFEVACTEDGAFSHDDYPHGGCDGKYFDDSLYFNYNESSQGRSVTYSFKGKKQ